MRCRPPLHPLIVAAIASALAAAACGESSTTRSTNESPSPPPPEDLDRFLVDAEIRGFSPSGEPVRLSTLSSYVGEFEASEDDEQRLRDHGFESFVAQPLEGPSAGGVISVSLFSTEEGATRELEHSVNSKEKDVNFEPFAVPGVPTATGWTYDDLHGHEAADVLWSQGRCVMNLGVEPSLVDRLRTAVKAFYERTQGRCP
jgi:hypothetical protein